ncbi:hypothetical protein DDE18_09060 [Nocardioides gansuensis]|uniref:Helix-hairpin-helix DNA-binding motif class 1 domain-containing protein n=1 Tax=Nocardioides gansuensis TaxID=2138300 RepID=A0A2T8FCJ1_9ACTN|nr:ComEA family DNA-binding protein [Nocardioides gansuensis]PVG83424.1 hypothetical protein DDE18_09060 [Nocardioides gansuensis]
MRSRSPSSEHAEAVSRRLATLSAELAAVRGEPPSEHQHTRLRAGPREEPPALADPAALPGPPAVPSPGRHAARRLADRVVLGPAHIAVVAVVAALAVGLAAWLVVRSQAEPRPVAAPAPLAEPLVETAAVPSASTSTAGVPAGAAQASAAGSTSGSAGAGEEVTVDVAGKVRRPGIAVLPAGSRVVDALEAAGGALRGVDLTSLNLARPLVDGEQVLVGVHAPAGVAGTVGQPGSPSASPGTLVDLNAADEAALETLPGVGPVTAAAIVAWRAEHGGFTAVDELLEVDGIGEATLAQIAPHVTI